MVSWWLEFSITTIDNKAPHWKGGEAIEDGTPPNAVVSRIGVRKGLFGGSRRNEYSYLIESELWAFGGYLKWALHEGMKTVPSILLCAAHTRKLLVQLSFKCRWLVLMSFSVGPSASEGWSISRPIWRIHHFG